MKIIALPLFALLVFFSCKKTEEKQLPPGTDFSFARYSCFCAGNSCMTAYQIKNNELFRGNGPLCRPDSLVLDANPLDAGNLALAETLRDALPSLMLTSSTDQYGCPGCDDGAAFYIRAVDNGTVRQWRIEPGNNDLPVSVKDFSQKIQQTLDALE